MNKIIAGVIVILILFFSWNLLRSTGAAEAEVKSSPEENEMGTKINKSDEEWKKILTPEQYRILRKAGTEMPFTGIYNDHYEKGLYRCAACGAPLFGSETKYDHCTGWPSFTSPAGETAIEYREDHSLFMKRIEVRCASCGSHLGHVFDDGPLPTRKHYCINSAALEFEGIVNNPSQSVPRSAQEGTKNASERATFAAGCFWGVEYKFGELKGVLSTEVGYTGGKSKNPTYRQVCSDETGHAEAVHVTYDPSVVSYEELVRFFFSIHDPTQLNRQGPDRGTQYRSAIFYHNEKQKETALKVIEELTRSKRFGRPIVTQVASYSEFYKAEEYHQKYYEKQKKK
jgi:peptide methionine sulfoxide reductase msrA/msrB